VPSKTPNVPSAQNGPVFFLKCSLLFNHIGRSKHFQWEDIHKCHLYAKYQCGLILNVAKYHLGKVKLEQMQPASMPFLPISFRQAKHELMQPAVFLLGNT